MNQEDVLISIINMFFRIFGIFLPLVVQYCYALSKFFDPVGTGGKYESKGHFFRYLIPYYLPAIWMWKYVNYVIRKWKDIGS